MQFIRTSHLRPRLDAHGADRNALTLVQLLGLLPVSATATTTDPLERIVHVPADDVIHAIVAALP